MGTFSLLRNKEIDTLTPRSGERNCSYKIVNVKKKLKIQHNLLLFFRRLKSTLFIVFEYCSNYIVRFIQYLEQIEIIRVDHFFVERAVFQPLNKSLSVG